VLTRLGFRASALNPLLVPKLVCYEPKAERLSGLASALKAYTKLNYFTYHDLRPPYLERST
jgi:hypothetical protein